MPIAPQCQLANKANVAAWSLGGASTLKAMLKAPERFERVMLIASAGLGTEVHWIFRLLAIPLVGELGLMPNWLTMFVVYRLLYARRQRAVTRQFMANACKPRDSPRFNNYRQVRCGASSEEEEGEQCRTK